MLTVKKGISPPAITLTLTCLLYGCSVFAPPAGDLLDSGLDSEADIANSADISASSSIRINGFDIALSDPYLWRDWQPVVSNPGADGGSPLRAAVTLVIVNREEIKRPISWKSLLESAEGEQFPLHWTDRAQIPQSATTLGSGQTYQLDLVVHNGPYLPVGSSASINFQFEINGDPAGDLSSGSVSVERTD
tara:strand:+ start:84 stop:656 length:573 start_codon:yes stop_codon:yes gene_type:complete